VFTEKNLSAFEHSLVDKLQKICNDNGIKIDLKRQALVSKSMNVGTFSHRNSQDMSGNNGPRVNTSLNNSLVNKTLPVIDSEAKSTKGVLNMLKMKMAVTTANQGKEEARLNTQRDAGTSGHRKAGYKSIDVELSRDKSALVKPLKNNFTSNTRNAEDPDDFLMSKHYADLRIKLGTRKGQTVGHGGTVSTECEYLPKDLEDNQWAEIHNYNYNMWVQDMA